MTPFVVGRDPWNREAMRRDALHARPLAVPRRHRQLRLGRHRHGALGLCGRACGEPLWRLLGGLQRAGARRTSTTSRARLAGEPRRRRSRRASPPASRSSISRSGSTTSRTSTWSRPCARRSAPAPRLRLDANGSWSLAAGDSQSRRARRVRHRLRRAARARPPDRPPCGAAPPHHDDAVRERGALVGGGRLRADPRPTGRRLLLLAVLGRIRSAGFQRLAWVAEYEGLQVCKHTHGELGLAAAAAHHVVLTLPNGVEGHQQTAHMS